MVPKKFQRKALEAYKELRISDFKVLKSLLEKLGNTFVFVKVISGEADAVDVKVENE